MKKKYCRTYVKVAPTIEKLESVNGVRERHFLQVDSDEGTEHVSHLEAMSLLHNEDGMWIKKASQ